MLEYGDTMGRFLLVMCGSGLMATALPAWAAERDIAIRSNAGAPVGVCELGSTLNMPPDAQALVVFVHGSGSQNRDESSPNGPAPFRDIADGLSARGIGSLRFDKRSSVKACLPAMTDPADPQRAHPDLRPEHFIKDIESVYRRAEQEAQGLPVFLLGHSEGVNYALELVAQRRIDPSGVILLAGLGRYSIDETFLRQLREALPKIDEALRKPGLTPERRHALEQARLQTRDLLSKGEVFFRRIKDGKDLPSDYYVGAYAPYWKEWIAITARATITASNANTASLLIQGSLDANVSKEDFDALASALMPAGGRSVYLNGLDHLFLKPGADRVDSSVTAAIADWIQDQTNGLNAGAKPMIPNAEKDPPALKQLESWASGFLPRGS